MSETPAILPFRRRAAGGSDLQIKLYDFRRPDKFSKEQIRTIAIMHESFARLAGARLTDSLRLDTKLRVGMVDQLTFSEFLSMIPKPTTLVPVSMKPLPGSSLLAVDRDLTAVIIERMYGGVGVSDAGCEYTDLEREVLSELLECLAGDLGEAWKPIAHAGFSLGGIETNKSLVLIVPPSEMVVLVSWEVTCGEFTGTMRFAIPYLVLEPILGKLSAAWWYSRIRRGPAPTPPSVVAAVPAEGEIYYPAGRIAISSLSELTPGARIPLPAYAAGNAVLRLGGRDLLSVSRADLPGRFTIQSQHVIRGEDVLAYLRGDGGSRDAPAGRTDIQQAVAAAIEPTLSALRTELSRISSQQAAFVDSAFLGEPREEDAAQTGERKPFGFVRAADAGSVAVLLRAQHPQITAMVLSYLEPRVGAAVLEALPDEIRPDIVRRIATIERMDPEVLTATENHLSARLQNMGAWRMQSPGGVEGASALLNYTSRGTEAAVIGYLDRSDPQMSDRIKKSMFVFEDLVILHPNDLRVILDETETEDLAVAIKTATPELRDALLAQLDQARRSEVEQISQGIGRLRLTDVDAAQQRIVETTRRLDLAGSIVVARPDETVE